MGQDNMLDQPHDRDGFGPGDALSKRTIVSSGVGHGVDGLSNFEITRGVMKVVDEQTSPYDPDNDGGGTHQGDPLNMGGFLSRPRGTAR